MLTYDQVTKILTDAGVLLEGHFLLTSGKHSNRYLQCAKLFRNARAAELICKELAERFQSEGIEVVIGPAMGAIQMAYEVSRALGVRCVLYAGGHQDAAALAATGAPIVPTLAAAADRILAEE